MKAIRVAGREPSPLDAAIMAKDVKQRIGSAEIFMDRIGAVDAQRPPLPKHQQSRRVVHLAVGEHNADNRRVADRSCGLRLWKCP